MPPTKDAATEETGIAIRPDSALASKYLAIQKGIDSVIETIETNLGGERISPSDLARIKMGLGGITQWIVEGVDGEEMAKTIQGIAIHMKLARSYWPGEFDGKKTPPQCWSDDSKYGMGDPGDHPEKAQGKTTGFDCFTCPQAQFGSDGGRGQACKQTRQVFLLDPKKLLPSVIILPPTSLTIMRKFLMGMASEDLSFHAAVIEFALKQVANPDGIKYAEVVPRVVERLSDEQALNIKRLAEALRPNLERIRIDDREAVGGARVVDSN